MSRSELAETRRWVVKIGSSLLTNDGKGLNHPAIAAWVAQLSELHCQGLELILVSSGAVAAGMERLGWQTRPRALAELQAAASIGQAALVQVYQGYLQTGGMIGAQVLLTHEDLRDRQRYLSARATLRTLLEMGTLPIINENDAVASAELRFGDNDTLAAMVSNLLEADLLIILTDQAGLYEADPRQHPEARLLHEVRAGDPQLLAMAGGAGSKVGTGGMRSKVMAASRAARSGTATIVASGHEADVLLRLYRGALLGTRFQPQIPRLAARKRWFVGQLRPMGTLRLDAGAARVLREKGSSLLPVGVTAVEGEFQCGDLVSCLDPEGQEIARGLINFASAEVAARLGKNSAEITELFGEQEAVELIHRDNLALLP
ncbi:glutamate 5-kinase [Acidithiobacillus sp. CV18-2]|uniref:Glutamate 5-kinase n=1 Tax=Igneacidithiobacillus copahuensis TaxID=2724909 RepID=A0AAE3CIW9_9PROT|nr:glutamate 5-kinase [Igneacidithiobacillus copahuensis]MBU2755381.1 glutamate 5-kinase [Acidithiobacillus sp. CV18-3]MBU2758579.1 glutamate 5-kinase [Acidithiobacillus sp. BN09-2]MBU2777359.1 glutamate 5-kinase [Acidithiobacillus sp. CV18-2]MBU2797759.1 glutamate 5-kinase [Acidithiobacillus sp. VAN18-2]MBU2798520.1 glutamate 5-kinase [Acidithiobacillus sp. VAN18-4]UTV80546.1 glutamate 5-kinase [Acidithiobacillus sp. YTS05]